MIVETRMHTGAANPGQEATNPLGMGSLASHVLLVHNLNPNWIFAINSPLWSVATEWQIYFIFPLILLPSWRKLGPTGAIAIAYAVGIGLHFAFGKTVDGACPWYIGQFALGMLAAKMSTPGRSETLNASVVAQLPIIGLACALTTVLIYRLGSASPSQTIIIDSLVAAATVCTVVFCSIRLSESSSLSKPLVLKLLESRLLVMLGVFSYSLYLIHGPIIAALSYVSFRSHMPANAAYASLLLVGPPLSVAAAYLFHLAFEKPFLRSSRKSKNPATQVQPTA